MWLNFPPTLSPQAGILKAGAAGVELPLKAKHALAQVMMGAAAAQRFTFSTRSRRVARELCFAQTARGPGPLSKMLSAALALANAVQFSACSGVLRVLGQARAGPMRGFSARGFSA
eukprot:scaffold12259_cov63-Phaeocystis_antarctica.AAC.1